MQPSSEIFFVMLTVAIIMLIFLWIVLVRMRRIKNAIQKTKVVIEQLMLGDLPDRNMKVPENEMAEVVDGLNVLLGNFRSVVKFAQKIGTGNLDAEFNKVSEKDALGIALIEMRESLRKVAEEDSKRNWATTGLAQLGETLRSSENGISELVDKILQFLVKYTKSNQGGLFVVNDEKLGEVFLELQACYAFERKRYMKKRIEKMEGLVSQCYLEQEIIFITNVPQDYVKITSGLGGENPNSLLLVPLKLNEKVYGVIELLSFNKYQEHEIEFVKKTSESIAYSISTAKINELTRVLLENSQQQTEEMRAQEEEMRQNMEELTATQEEMTRKNAEVERLLSESSKNEGELQVRLEEVARMKKFEDARAEERITFVDNYKKTLLGVLDNLPHKIFLKDQDGKMVIVNTSVAKAHNMSVDELIGKSDFDFVDAKTAQEWRNQELEIIRKGSETYVHSDSIGGETRKLKTVKSAFYIPHLNQTGLLGIQTDITDLEKKN